MSSGVIEPMGKVFTQRWVVEWMLDLGGYDTREELFTRTVLEPSCGTGAFLVPIVERLLESCAVHGVCVEDAGDALRAVELHEPSVRVARDRVRGLLLERGVASAAALRLVERWVVQDDFLLAEDLPSADLVVGNPPYVRLEGIPPALMGEYRSR